MTQADQTDSSYRAEAETTLGALRRQEVDAVIGDNHVLLLRLQEAEKNLHESEERLRKLNKTLEQRIAERTTELEQQAQRLRHLTYELTKAEQRERKRLAQMLHDGLQQILLAIQINLTLLPPDSESEELQQARQLVRKANQASRSLTYELAPPALYQSTFSQALAWLARWFNENHHFHVSVNVADDLSTLAENEKVFLFNAIRELLLNSVKHSGVQEAEVHCTSAGDDWWQIEVQDTGKGFDPAYLHDTTDTEKGFGLLSIRERLIALGGTLEIRSEPDAGAHFVLSFPVGASEADIPQPRLKARHIGADTPDVEDAGRQGPTIRILVVDDHRMVREALAAILQRQVNFQVVGEGGDGAEAIELADQLRPDVIVMDVNMPHMDGIEATRRIKEKHSAIHVIGLSWREEGNKAQAMRDAGATAYLHKEAAAETLIETVMSAAVGKE